MLDRVSLKGAISGVYDLHTVPPEGEIPLGRLETVVFFYIEKKDKIYYNVYIGK